MHHYLTKTSLGLTLWITSLIITTAEPATPTTPESANPKKAETPGYEVTPTEIKLPGVTINRAKREVRIDAEVCLQEGILEFVVVRPDTFEHESIFTTNAKPEFLHAALLLCGLKPSPAALGVDDAWVKEAMKQGQSRVKIEVEWKEKEVQKRVNLTSLLVDREYDPEESDEDQNDQPKQETKLKDAWIFAGSYLHTNRETGQRLYVANRVGILVGIWPDPSTVIQYGVTTGNPYESERLGLEINEKAVPKIGTKVKLVFSLYAPPNDKKEEPQK